MLITSAGPAHSGKTRLAELQKQGILSQEVVDTLCETGGKLRLPEHDVPWEQIQQSYRDQGDVSREHLGLVADFTQDAVLARRALEREIKDKEKATPTELKRLSALDNYLEPALKVREGYLEATSRAAVGALAGASFGPLATVAAYLTWNPAPEARVKSLVEKMTQLSSGNSELITEGNEVEPVGQEQLWQAKAQLLEEAVELARQGNPPEINVQYFEMTSSSFMRRLAEAARAGCKVRINIDPSRPRRAETADVSIDDGPRKLRALLQMAQLEGADVGFSIFPVATALGKNSNLMHRKLLRVGEKVLLGGMNANEGSGENYDTAYILKGPAARRLIEGFQVDVETSREATAEQVYGEKVMAQFEDGSVALSPHGIATTLDALSGPSPAGTRIPAKPSLEMLSELAKTAGVRLGDLVDRESLEEAISKGSTRPLELKPRGKRLLSELVTRVFDKLAEPSNQKRLLDIGLPEGQPQGSTRVAVAGQSEDREALVLSAIAQAEQFCYVPTFVITRAVARALVARRDELAAQGKTLDIKVIADSGTYGYGGTPNEEGYLALEEAGIPVRWSLLTRVQMDHDRKVHSKQILTEKVDLIGSTNLSNKGIRDNWELSGLVYFDEQAQARQEAVDRFNQLWNHESVALDTRAAADAQGLKGVGREEARKKSMRRMLGLIQNYELQSAKWMEQQMARPEMLQRANGLQALGMAYGYARLQAVREGLGEEAFWSALRDLPTRQKVEAFGRGEPLAEE